MNQIVTTAAPAVKAKKKDCPTHRMSWVKFIAQSVQRYSHFKTVGDAERALRVWNALYSYVGREAPSGSGLDAGTFLCEESRGNVLVFCTSFHHMDEHGGYDGWTEHKVVVKPAFYGIDIRITGRDRNQIKDYLGDLFHGWLTAEKDHPALVEYTDL